MKKSGLIVLVCLLALVFTSCSVSIAEPAVSVEPPPTAVPTPTPAPIDTPPPTPAPIETDPPTQAPPSQAPVGDKASALAAYKSLTANLVTTPDSQMAIDIDMTMDMKLHISGETQTNYTTGNIKTKDMGGGKVACSMYLDMGAVGVMEVVTDGDSIYAALNGVKIDISMDGLDDQLDSTVNFPELNLEAMLDVTTWQEGSLNYTHITADGKKLTAFANDFAKQMTQTMGTSVDCEIGDMTILLVTDENEIPKSMSIEVEMRMSAMGESIGIDLSYEYLVNAYGSDVEIDFSKLG